MQLRVESLKPAVVCLALELLVWALATPTSVSPATEADVQWSNDTTTTVTPPVVKSTNILLEIHDGGTKVSSTVDYVNTSRKSLLKADVHESGRWSNDTTATVATPVANTTNYNNTLLKIHGGGTDASSTSDYANSPKKTLLTLHCPDKNQERFINMKWTVVVHTNFDRNLYRIKAGSEVTLYKDAGQYINDLREKHGVELTVDNTSALNIWSGCNYTASYRCYRSAHVGYKYVTYTFSVKNCTVSLETPAEENDEIVTSTTQQTWFTTEYLYHILLIVCVVLFIATIVGIAYYV